MPMDDSNTNAKLAATADHSHVTGDSSFEVFSCESKSFDRSARGISIDRFTPRV